MATIEEHCKDCRSVLGEDFRNVHEWLDEFFPTKGLRHRGVRHHREGIEEIRNMWGNRAARAAHIHIKKDCYGKIPSREEAELWDMLT